MSKFDVYDVPTFEKLVQKMLSKSETKDLNSFIEKLKNGKLSGKRLTYEFLREKKIGGKRIYFLIYHDIYIILFVSISSKKAQKSTIRLIKKEFPYYKKYVQKLKAS